MRHSSMWLVAAVPVLVGVASAQAVPMTNLELWVRADAGVQESPGDAAEDGDDTAIWLDQSGNGRDLAVGPVRRDITFTAPTYLATAANGQPAIVFDAGVEQLQASDPILTGTTDFHIFSVAQVPAGPPGQEHVVGANYGFGNSAGLEFYVYHNQLYLYPSGLNAGVATGSALRLLEAERSGTNTILRIDGVEVLSGSWGGAIGANLPWTLGSGADYASSNSPTLPLTLAEHLVYSDNLEAADRAALVTELGIKYGLNVPVPEPASLGLLAAGSLLLLRRRA